MHFFSSVDFWVVVFLIISVASVWVSTQPSAVLFGCLPVYHWYWPFLLTLGLALFSGALSVVGIAVIAVFAALCIFYHHDKPPAWLKAILLTAIIVVSLLLGFHALPGFDYIVLVSDIQYSEFSSVFNLGYGIDKYLVGLCLVGFLLPKLSSLSSWKAMLVKIVPIFVVTAIVVFTLGLLLGYVGIDVKLPEHVLLWMAINLFLVCVTEEAFFRGIIQHKLASALAAVPYGGVIALMFTAALFGLAHIGGGWLYVGLAAVAGLSYGWAFYKTQSIEAAILVHFGVNLVHILFFTYPTLVSV